MRPRITKELLSLCKMKPNQSSDIPSWSLFTDVVHRTLCPHCKDFHSVSKLHKIEGVSFVCMMADYMKNLEVARELFREL